MRLLRTVSIFAFAAASSALLLDQLAGTRKAQQLIDALRQKIADQQVIDLRPRRVLHDEIANHLMRLLDQGRVFRGNADIEIDANTEATFAA